VTAIHMRITQGNELVADLPKWKGPVPRQGDYIFHPPSSAQPDREQISGRVACVKWRTHDRTEDNEFTMTAHPYVELVLGS
jgi:hypothetical protein